MPHNPLLKLIGQITFCLLISCITPFIQAQSTIHFEPFTGTVYDIPGDDLSSGYTHRVAYYDEMGKITLDSLAVPKTFVGAKYFPGLTLRTGFGIVFLSQLEISEKGCYEFYLESDDGSKLWIKDSLIIDNDGPHKMIAIRDTMSMDPGRFPVKVWYYNAFESQFGLILRGRALSDTVLCGSLRKMALEADAVLFDFNSYVITSAGMKALDKLCAQLEKLKFRSVHVIGYTDQTGSEAYNKELSLKRAQSISTYLKSKIRKTGILFKVEGRGESNARKLEVKDTLNRRVEIFIE